MYSKTVLPSFEEFLRFVATRHRTSARAAAPPQWVLAAAEAARKEIRALDPSAPRAHGVSQPGTDCEVLELLAASAQHSPRPSELVTVRGFRVRLVYQDGTDTEPSSICILVQCPEQWIGCVQGRIAYLWNGEERFELGEFDADGKAIGTLPVGIEMSVTDLATGRVRLEAPDVPAHD